MVVAKDELDTLLQHQEMAMKSCPILFYANKMDMKEALNAIQVN